MEAIVKNILETKYDGVCIETQHGNLRVNHSLRETKLLFEILSNFNKERGVGLELISISDTSVSEKIRDSCIEAAIKISKEYGYDTSWIPENMKHLTSMPLNILSSSLEHNCFHLASPIQVSVVKSTQSYYKVEFNSGKRRWVVELNGKLQEIDLKRLENNLYLGIVKIERGIICTTEPNKEIAVSGAGFLARLNTKSLYERTYNIDEKVLGFVIDNSFNVCHLFRLKSGEEFMGYIVNNGFGSTAIRVRLISDFNLAKFDPYNATYELGEEKVLQKETINGFWDEKAEGE